MTDEKATVSEGLEDVLVAETRLSEVDGEHGHLTIAGESVEAVAENRTLEEVALRLRRAADGRPLEVPAVELSQFRRRLGRARRVAFEALTGEGGFRRRVFERDEPMEALRAALAAMESRGEPDEDAPRIVGAIPVANALWLRAQDDRPPVAPDPDASHAADYLRMIAGEKPSGADVEALERYLMAVSDHGVNASTFTARVIASTGSDTISALVGAVGALKGPLHGGAPGPVLDMFDAIGEADRAAEWIRDELDAGRRIMGMGHRVYRVRDPRAAVFEEAIGRLAARPGTDRRLELARSVESAAEEILAERHPDRDLRANVEFYTAVLLEAVGIPRELFTATFAAGRAFGWVAHVVEQKRTGRLIRPRARYVGGWEQRPVGR